MFSEEEIDGFFDCGVEDIENIIDICKAYDAKCPHEYRLDITLIINLLIQIITMKM